MCRQITILIRDESRGFSFSLPLHHTGHRLRQTRVKFHTQSPCHQRGFSRAMETPPTPDLSFKTGLRLPLGLSSPPTSRSDPYPRSYSPPCGPERIVLVGILYNGKRLVRWGLTIGVPFLLYFPNPTERHDPLGGGTPTSDLCLRKTIGQTIHPSCY